MGKSRNRFCIVVSGLPASGKTTVGRKVAHELAIPFYDKDDYLESLYESRGIGDGEWRQMLSRESDLHFQQAAKQEATAVLVSHWRPPTLDTQSGTPTGWLTQSFEKVIEIYCQCPAKTAVQRFFARERHPGHLDKLKNYNQTLSWMQEYEQFLPLGFRDLIIIDSSQNLFLDQLVGDLNQIIKD